MKWIKDMKIGVKLQSFIMALITGVVGIIGITDLKELQKENTALYEDMTLPIAQVGQISTSYQRMRVM